MFFNPADCIYNIYIGNTFYQSTEMVSILRKAMQKCFIVLVLKMLVLGFVKGQKHVCLKKEIVNNELILKCKVDRMGLAIRFYHNDQTFGDCLPHVSTKRNDRVIKCNDNITQNLDTNVTTLRIQNIDEYNVSGVWICEHGSYKDVISISIPKMQPSNLCKISSEYTNAVIAVLVFIVIALTGIIVFLVMRLRNEPAIQNEIGGARVLALGEGRGIHRDERDIHREERMPLLENAGNMEEHNEAENGNDVEEGDRTEDEHINGFVDICDNCKNPSTCAICSDCEKLYCDICCRAHKKYYPGHIVCQTEHFFKSQNVVKCKICTKEISTNVCKECKKVLCKHCITEHTHNKDMLKDLNPDFTSSIRSKTQESDIKEIEYVGSIVINQEKSDIMIKVCGIAFLSDCRVVVVDNKNNVLMVFDMKHLEFQESLKDEPRGIAQMTENQIAVTFAYIFEIKILKVSEKSMVPIKTINILSLNLGRLKPFSISFDQGCFAVEAGEGDDGCVLILDEEGKFKKQIFVESRIAHFSANTIRIALDMRKDGNIFISGMSRKSVSCINLNGKIIWTVQVPEPRGLVVIQEETISKQNIIVASKSCNVVFRLNRHDGSDGVLLAKGIIKDPRYIAYHQGNRLLCIHVTEGQACPSGQHKLILYMYKDFVGTSTINEITRM